MSFPKDSWSGNLWKIALLISDAYSTAASAQEKLRIKFTVKKFILQNDKIQQLKDTVVYQIYDLKNLKHLFFLKDILHFISLAFFLADEDIRSFFFITFYASKLLQINIPVPS